MSRYTGPQGRGAAKRARELRRSQAYDRQVKYWLNNPTALSPTEMLPVAERAQAPDLPKRLLLNRGHSEVDCG